MHGCCGASLAHPDPDVGNLPLYLHKKKSSPCVSLKGIFCSQHLCESQNTPLKIVSIQPGLRSSRIGIRVCGWVIVCPTDVFCDQPQPGPRRGFLLRSGLSCALGTMLRVCTPPDSAVGSAVSSVTVLHRCVRHTETRHTSRLCEKVCRPSGTPAPSPC